ncbi:hypothetical protein FVB32_05335 [Flagellimonas hymeniacidonis]|uniref:Conjugative transposon protein TraO n=1 Tax=Flagellimonas hymeniacidonis TaxID=2603628 RepID=A0A5C8V7M7_9FLAO|nr:conjugal transfer protein TraO [Flagellimonas hymeniacidonis]TXN37712.1 hypothetical protein FVB32_05335 [Flagellimonas hymeniacidonis]
MKKKNVLLVALATVIFMTTSCAIAQRSTMAFELSPGYAQEGFGGKATFNYFHNRTDYLQAAVIATFSREAINPQTEIPYTNYLLNAGYFKPVFSNRMNSFTLFLGGGASIGYEVVNKGNTDLPDGSLLVSESQFVYGPFVGLIPDYSISDQFSLILPLDLFYHFGSDLGGVHFLAGFGVRYYLN